MDYDGLLCGERTKAFEGRRVQGRDYRLMKERRRQRENCLSKEGLPREL